MRGTVARRLRKKASEIPVPDKIARSPKLMEQLKGSIRRAYRHMKRVHIRGKVIVGVYKNQRSDRARLKSLGR